MSGRRAVILVRNGVTHDARVHREIDALRHAGFDPLVVGVTTADQRERHDTAAGAPVLRLSPRSPMARVRDRLVRRPPAAPAAAPPAPSSAAPAPRSAPRRAAHALHRTLTAADFYRQAAAALRAQRPALVHCNDWNTMWVGVVARLLGARVVYDSHELWPDRNGRPECRPWLLLCEALFVRVAHEVVTTSPGYAEVLRRRHRIRPPVLVRNVPDATAPHVAPRRPFGEEHVVVYAGGLLRGRGLEPAIDALALLPGARLELIGPGAPGYRAELAARAARAGVGDRVRLPGPVPPQELVATLAGADAGLCLIQPVCLSYELTLPNKLFEYAAAGLPMLASDLPVIAGVVREWQAGEVVAHDDPAAIAAGLRRLLEPDRAMTYRSGARALASAVTWEGERDRLLAVYTPAKSGHRPASSVGQRSSSRASSS